MMNDWLQLIFNGDYGAAQAGPETAVLVLLLSFVIGHFIGWVYMRTHSVLSYSQTFAASLVVVPVIVGLMMVLMAGSIVVAFGLLAVFAVVRFRNVLKDTRDTTFILWAIMEGLSVGTLRFSTAVIGAIGIAAVLIYLKITAFGSRHRYDADLTLQLTGDLVGGLAKLKQVLHRHNARVFLTSERELTDEGLALSYRLLLRDPSRSDELQWDLKQTEGIQRLSFHVREDEMEI